ncbi:hypothetical protein NE565_24020, partial [Phocaeicola vulgatus]|nr:hypothetical protein [Phocaeicola vulgatus]
FTTDGKIIAKNGEFSGTVVGVSGSFKSLNCVNNSGDIVGGSSFGSDGKIIAKNGEFSGTVVGVSGSFKSLNCVNNSGDIVGGISFGSDGKMWFNGDLYH